MPVLHMTLYCVCIVLLVYCIIINYCVLSFCTTNWPPPIHFRWTFAQQEDGRDCIHVYIPPQGWQQPPTPVHNTLTTPYTAWPGQSKRHIAWCTWEDIFNFELYNVPLSTVTRYMRTQENLFASSCKYNSCECHTNMSLHVNTTRLMMRWVCLCYCIGGQWRLWIAELLSIIVAQYVYNAVLVIIANAHVHRCVHVPV